MNNMKETIKKISTLAHLSLPEALISTYAERFSSIVTYIEQLKELNTENIQPMSHTTGILGQLRKDSPITTNPDEIIKAAPERDGKFYQVPRVI